MSESKYTWEKPIACKYCYWWNTKMKKCEMEEANCYYILSKKKRTKYINDCKKCPYGRHRPCVGFCIKKLLKNETGTK